MMKQLKKMMMRKRSLLLHTFVALLFSIGVLGQSSRENSGRRNITATEGTKVILRCQSKHMVKMQDRLKDRQRVVHWDLFRSTPDFSVERIVDMFPGAEQRIYNSFNKGRISLSKDAFGNGNFSLLIKDVGMNDKGIYSCHLHHHYCQLNESIKVQLNVTKSPRKERQYWDGEKAVFVSLLGNTVSLPCVNRRPLWTRRQRDEEQQQLVRWEHSSLAGNTLERPGRLLDLRSSGGPPQYGPVYSPQRMNVSARAFALGDFSLSIAGLQTDDEGVYTCHLRHQYCGLHERISYQLTVDQPAHVEGTGKELPVVNVIVPKNNGHLYILAVLVIVVLIASSVVLLTCQCKKRGTEYHLRRAERDLSVSSEPSVGFSQLKMCNQEELRLDYRNNIWKERADVCKLPSPKVIDLDTEMERMTWN